MIGFKRLFDRVEVLFPVKNPQWHLFFENRNSPQRSGSLKQIHSRHFVTPEEPNFVPVEADGLDLSPNIGGVWALRFADCVPVAVFDTQTQRMALLHCGFAGTRFGLAQNLCDHWKRMGLNAQHWFVVLGPCVGPTQYSRNFDNDQSSQEAAQQFHKENFWLVEDQIFFNLIGELRSQFCDCGVHDHQISWIGDSTIDRDDLWYSYRRGDQLRHAMVAQYLKN